MAAALFEEYRQWEPRAKLELIDGKLVVSKSLTHSRLLLQQLLRGWGLEAAITLAPETLWWQALSAAFAAPPIADRDASDFAQQRTWANTLALTPEAPTFQSHWHWKRSEVREGLHMAFFQLSHQHQRLGSVIGGSFVNRLGNDALMPDVMFYRSTGRNQLDNYYLDGAAEVVVECITPGCEAHDLQVKRSRYQAAGVPELWTVDSERETIEFQCWVNGTYETRFADAHGRYAVSSIPGLTFLPDRLWVKQDNGYRGNWDLFEVSPELDSLPRPCSEKDGIDWHHLPTQFSIGLAPEAIAFADYLYWVPESKFEMVDGKPWIGGKAGIRGLIGMLLMTLGLVDVVRLFHPQQWVEALIDTRTQIQHDAQRKAEWWALAHRAAALLRTEYGATRLAVAGDLLKTTPLNFWSEFYLVSWDLPIEAQTAHRLYDSLRALSSDPEICHLENDDDRLYPPEQRLVEAGVVEI
ncbi:MAG: Uma2 family endonuclease [Verrucomicrobia bacterium]|nr:Uma2 family endonuclease [Leptolyngbya sp. ES-bin-22]